MTNQHPLTDEILHEKFNSVYHGNLIIFDADDMRAVKSFIVELQKQCAQQQQQQHRRTTDA